MEPILTGQNHDLLRQFARSTALLAFDFDGTLAPIVKDPTKARLRVRTRGLLARVARVYPCVVISSRPQRDILQRLRGVEVAEVIGNHGIDPSEYTGPLVATVRRWLPLLNARFSSLQGVTIEDKSFSVAIHYRQSRQKKRAVEEIRGAVQALGDVRVIWGKMVCNVLPADAPHKGMALRAARARLQCDTAIYVGDDDTDEDVFSLDEPGRLLAIRVGASETSQAAYFIPGQGQVDVLLKALLSYRPDGRGQR